MSVRLFRTDNEITDVSGKYFAVGDLNSNEWISYENLKPLINNVKQTSFTLTEAQILAWGSGVTYTALPDLGASQRYVIHKAIAYRPFPNSAYTDVGLGYIALANSTAGILSRFIDIISDGSKYSSIGYIDGTSNSNIYYSSATSNSKVDLIWQIGGSAPTGGTGGIRIEIWYEIIDFVSI